MGVQCTALYLTAITDSVKACKRDRAIFDRIKSAVFYHTIFFFYSKPTDLLPKTEGADLDKPDEDEVKKSTDDTRDALEKLINAKVWVLVI